MAMLLGKILAVTVVGLLIVGFEWPKINREYKKERVALLVFTVLGWGLWLLILSFPDLPGPTQLMRDLMHPFTRWGDRESAWGGWRRGAPSPLNSGFYRRDGFIASPSSGPGESGSRTRFSLFADERCRRIGHFMEYLL